MSRLWVVITRFGTILFVSVLQGSWVVVGSCQVNLLKTGQIIVRKPVKANSGYLKDNQIITFPLIQIFFTALFCVYGDY